jgi:hypothetical protein
MTQTLWMKVEEGRAGYVLSTPVLHEASACAEAERDDDACMCRQRHVQHHSRAPSNPSQHWTAQTCSAGDALYQRADGLVFERAADRVFVRANSNDGRNAAIGRLGMKIYRIQPK